MQNYDIHPSQKQNITKNDILLNMYWTFLYYNNQVYIRI